MNKDKFLFLAAKAKKSRYIDTVLRYHPLYYNRAKWAIKKFNSSSVNERLALSSRYCSRIIKIASKSKYGKRFGNRLENWPILTKSLVRDHPDYFTSRKIISIPASTGGTTGTPIKLVRSLECIAAEQAFIDRLLEKYSLSFHKGRVAVLRADEIKDPSDNKPPYGIYTHSKRRLVFSNSHLSMSTVNWFVKELSEFSPDVLWVYPSMIANFLKLVETYDLKVKKVPIVLTSSETLDLHTSDTIKEKLGADVIDYYGQGERVCFAASYKPNEYWFYPSYGYVELIPKKSARNADGNIMANIVATGYWNSVMPLVRYDTGDLAILPASCSEENIQQISLGMKPFLGIAGRTNEYIFASGGRKIGGLNHLPRNVKNMYRLQVIQKSLNKLTINVLARPKFSNADAKRIIDNARELIPCDIEINIEKVDNLERAPNGKAPFVIRQI